MLPRPRFSQSNQQRYNNQNNNKNQKRRSKRRRSKRRRRRKFRWPIFSSILKMLRSGRQPITVIKLIVITIITISIITVQPNQVDGQLSRHSFEYIPNSFHLPTWTLHFSSTLDTREKMERKKEKKKSRTFKSNQTANYPPLEPKYINL